MTLKIHNRTFKIHNNSGTTFKIHNFVCVVYLGLVVTKIIRIFAAEYVTIGLLCTNTAAS